MKKISDTISVKGIRVKLIPTKQQEYLLTQFIGTRRFAYDWALELRTNTWVNENRFIPLSELLLQNWRNRNHVCCRSFR